MKFTIVALIVLPYPPSASHRRSQRNSCTRVHMQRHTQGARHTLPNQGNSGSAQVTWIVIYKPNIISFFLELPSLFMSTRGTRSEIHGLYSVELPDGHRLCPQIGEAGCGGSAVCGAAASFPELRHSGRPAVCPPFWQHERGHRTDFFAPTWHPHSEATRWVCTRTGTGTFCQRITLALHNHVTGWTGLNEWPVIWSSVRPRESNWTHHCCRKQIHPGISYTTDSRRTTDTRAFQPSLTARFPPKGK